MRFAEAVPDPIIIWSDNYGELLKKHPGPAGDQTRLATAGTIFGAIWHREGQFELCLYDCSPVDINGQRVTPPQVDRFLPIPLGEGDQLHFLEDEREYVLKVVPATPEEMRSRDAEFGPQMKICLSLLQRCTPKHEDTPRYKEILPGRKVRGGSGNDCGWTILEPKTPSYLAEFEAGRRPRIRLNEVEAMLLRTGEEFIKGGVASGDILHFLSCGLSYRVDLVALSEGESLHRLSRTSSCL